MANKRIPSPAQGKALAVLETFDPTPCTTRKPNPRRLGSEAIHISGTVARTLELDGWARRSKPHEHATHWDVRITLEGRQALDRWNHRRAQLDAKAGAVRALAEATKVDRWELGAGAEPVFVTPAGDGVYFSELGHRSVPPVLAARARAALTKLIQEKTP